LVPDRDYLGKSESYKREEVNQFLAEMNECGKAGVLVVTATNRPNLIDSAILRSGRMDKIIPVGPPDYEARKELFKFYLNGRPVSADINYDSLSKITENYAGSDIELIVEESARKAVKSGYQEITQALIEEIINRLPSSISDNDIAYFNSFSKEIKRW
jgi:transitional endoplasmic reticulum ATPase